MNVVAASISTTVIRYRVETIKDMKSPYPLKISQPKNTLLQQYYSNYTKRSVEFNTQFTLQ